MKKSFLIGLLICLLAVPAWGHPPIRVFVDDAPVIFSDQAPVIVEDRTLVPMRRIFEAMDATVTWSEPTQTITAVRNTDTVTMVIGNKEVKRNGQVVYTMDVPAQIMQDRTMVPIRAVAKAFDADIRWDGDNYIIYIASPKQATPASTENAYHKEIFAEDKTLLLTVTYNYTPLRANTEAAKKINADIRTALTKKGEAMTAQYTEAAQTLYNTAKKNGSTFNPLYSMGSYTVSAETANFASIVLRERHFTGDTEQVSVSSWLYNMKNGNKSVLTDVVPDSETELQTLMQSGFYALIDANAKGFHADAKQTIAQHPEYIHFYLEKDKIIFYINPGVIAEPHAGVIAYAVPYSF